jgi:hypothetical protein
MGSSVESDRQFFEFDSDIADIDDSHFADILRSARAQRGIRYPIHALIPEIPRFVSCFPGN